MNHKLLYLLPVIVLATALRPNAARSVEPPADLPESAAMFERLINRIPADVDPDDVHEYVGKPFEYSLHAGNSDDEETAMMGFVVSGQLYAVHCKRTTRPVLTVYRLSTFIPGYTPVTKDGDEFSRVPERTNGFPTFDTRLSKKRDKTSGLAQIADLYAVIDGRAKGVKLPFSYSVLRSISHNAE